MRTTTADRAWFEKIRAIFACSARLTARLH